VLIECGYVLLEKEENLMNLDYLQICIAFISCCQSIKDLAEVRGAR